MTRTRDTTIINKTTGNMQINVSEFDMTQNFIETIRATLNTHREFTTLEILQMWRTALAEVTLESHT